VPSRCERGQTAGSREARRLAHPQRIRSGLSLMPRSHPGRERSEATSMTPPKAGSSRIAPWAPSNLHHSPGSTSRERHGGVPARSPASPVAGGTTVGKDRHLHARGLAGWRPPWFERGACSRPVRWTG
jgi:hypothetical protein